MLPSVPLATPAEPFPSAAAGAVAGFLAALVMGVPMRRQAEGFTPAYLAASVVTRRRRDRVTFGTALAVHQAAGTLAGVLYALVAVGVGAALPATVAVRGVDLLAHLLAVAGVVTFIYAFFAHGVLPRVGGRLYEERATAVRGSWLRSALAFGAALLVLGPPVVLAVR